MNDRKIEHLESKIAKSRPRGWLRRPWVWRVVMAVIIAGIATAGYGLWRWLGACFAYWETLTPEQIAIRKSFGEVLAGGLAVLGFAVLLWRTWIADKQAKTAAEQAKTAADGQLTERFIRAVEQLGNEKSLAIRLGGIYALERIAQDSERDHWTVMEVLRLCAFLRLWGVSNVGAEPSVLRRPRILRMA